MTMIGKEPQYAKGLEPVALVIDSGRRHVNCWLTYLTPTSVEPTEAAEVGQVNIVATIDSIIFHVLVIPS